MSANEMNLLNNRSGFTLVEVMVSLAVFAVGFVGFLLMSTTAIKGNSSAFRITTAGNWAQDRLELVLAMPYNSHNNALDDDGDGIVDNNEEKFNDRNTDGVAGLDDTDGASGPADYSMISPAPDDNYNIFWNVAEDYPRTNTKTVRVIVRNRLLGSELSFTNIKIVNK